MNNPYHSMVLPTRTVEGKIPLTIQKKKFESLDLPDLKGKRVLDIGCWDGYYAFECAKRGAEVVAIESDITHSQLFPKYMREFQVKVSHYKGIAGNVYRLPRLFDREFDIILMLGVLYHLKHPIFGLEQVESVLRQNGLLVVESHLLRLDESLPMAMFYGNMEKPTCQWGFNSECVKEMVKSVGFSECTQIHELPTKGKKTRGTFHIK